MERHARLNLWYLMLALVGIMYLHDLWLTVRQVEPIPYGEFVAQLQQDNVAEVQVGARHLAGRLKQPLADGRSRERETLSEADLARLTTAVPAQPAVDANAAAARPVRSAA